ncbi:MAG TPA: type II toxin-antitoxin system PrlF family antitoxin [Vicinamibacterales bacterium]|nr:type II toxin-antitoxin system PrlF family antitoxin [Vicinamibacterales bacterium]
MPRSTITRKGQTTIPKVVRERLGVAYGDQIDFVMKPDGTVVVEAAKIPVSALKGLLRKEGQRVVSIEEMNETIRDGWAGKK